MNSYNVCISLKLGWCNALAWATYGILLAKDPMVNFIKVSFFILGDFDLYFFLPYRFMAQI